MNEILDDYIEKINLAFLKRKEDFEQKICDASDQDDADNAYSSVIFYQHSAAEETLKAIDLARNKKFFLFKK